MDDASGIVRSDVCGRKIGDLGVFYVRCVYLYVRATGYGFMKDFPNSSRGSCSRIILSVIPSSSVLFDEDRFRVGNETYLKSEVLGDASLRN